MNIDDIIKVLDNGHRREILSWLKEPRKNFPQPLPEHENLPGACASYIFQKASLSQATVSQYLAALERAGLVTRSRHGQWTFFARNEAAIAQAAEMLSAELKGE